MNTHTHTPDTHTHAADTHLSRTHTEQTNTWHAHTPDTHKHKRLPCQCSGCCQCSSPLCFWQFVLAMLVAVCVCVCVCVWRLTGVMYPKTEPWNCRLATAWGQNLFSSRTMSFHWGSVTMRPRSWTGRSATGAWNTHTHKQRKRVTHTHTDHILQWDTLMTL